MVWIHLSIILSIIPNFLTETRNTMTVTEEYIAINVIIKSILRGELSTALSKV